MPSPKFLWQFYPTPWQGTQQQINANFLRLYRSNPTAEQIEAWKAEFIERLQLDEKRAKYLQELNYEKILKQWEENKPKDMTLNYRKGKNN